MMSWWRRASLVAATCVTVFALAGCEPETPWPGGDAAGDEARSFGTALLSLSAYCTAQVEGRGRKDVETDYIPRVIRCENGSAPFEALKAQAVAARSYLYYKLNRSGAVGDGQHDQVYTCGPQPSELHYRAAAETAGLVLQYSGTQVAAFYVAGAIPSTDSCVARSSDTDHYNTERYVTYNWGKSGSGIEQTTLGWVNSGNHANRGCKSQNGASCLANKGWGFRDILKFYYGMDIAFVQAEGSCVDPPATCEPHCEGDRWVEADCDERNCAAEGAYCSTAGSPDPRCVSTDCVDSRHEAPVAHDVCPPGGQRFRCTASGQKTAKPCDGGAPCNACGKCGALPAETCNAKDDDCDGKTDEGVKNACGGCGQVPEETCNEEDDDCDGETDEGVENACGDCGPLPDESCNGEDDDCDGRTDEGFAGLGDPCEVGSGACRTAGTVVCAEGGRGAVCSAELREATIEVCNGEDDDCDGEVDEGFGLGVPCMVGLGACAVWGEIACHEEDPAYTTCRAEAPSCEDGDPCTDDRCDPQAGCLHEAREGCCRTSDDCAPGRQCDASECVPVLCAPCDSDEDCEASDAACVDYDDGAACATACPEGECPEGFTCEEIAGDEGGPPRCVWEGEGRCPPTPVDNSEGGPDSGGPDSGHGDAGGRDAGDLDAVGPDAAMSDPGREPDDVGPATDPASDPVGAEDRPAADDKGGEEDQGTGPLGDPDGADLDASDALTDVAASPDFAGAGSSADATPGPTTLPAADSRSSGSGDCAAPGQPAAGGRSAEPLALLLLALAALGRRRHGA